MSLSSGLGCLGILVEILSQQLPKIRNKRSAPADCKYFPGGRNEFLDDSSALLVEFVNCVCLSSSNLKRGFHVRLIFLYRRDVATQCCHGREADRPNRQQSDKNLR